MSTVSYIRYALDTGRYIAKSTKDKTWPPPEPRNDNEGIKVLTNEEVGMISTRPQMFRYDLLTPTELYFGEISASSDTFYPTSETFEADYPELDDVIFIMVRFADMPTGELIKVRINTEIIELENFDETPFELRSHAQGLFTVTLVDHRCAAEPSNLFLNCASLPMEG